MNTLIVFAHPEPQSFCAAMKNAAADVLKEEGKVEISDLYAMRFKAVADESDFLKRENPDYFNYALEQRFAQKNGTLSPDIVAELEKIERADFLLFIFPLYWYSVPAILKGYFDRVFVSGKAYGGKRIYNKGGFFGKRAMLAFSLGGHKGLFGEKGIHGEIKTLLKPILQGTLGYVGLDVLEPFVAYHIPYLSFEERQNILQHWQHYLNHLNEQIILPKPDLNLFDEKLNPL